MLPWSGVVKAGDTTVEGAVLADPDHGHLLTVTPSVLKGKQRLKAFVELVFLNLLEPDIEWKAILLGRRSQDKHLAVTIGPLGRTPAERHQQAEMILTDLVDLYREGHRVPLPLPCESGYRWQRGLATDRNKAWKDLREAWETDRYNAESLDSAHLLLLADLRDTAALLESRFEEYCERLWLPILSRCREKLL
jgi:exodeoxyribonuclease V gamma subunit